MGYSEPATYFRCSDHTEAFQAFPLGKLGCFYGLKTQFTSFTRSAGTGHVQDVEKWYFLHVDTCVLQSFCSLFLRAGAEGHTLQ